MGKIQLTPAELLSQSAEMDSLKGEYDALFRSVEGILNDTNSNWSANLSNNFSSKIITVQNGFCKIIEMLQFGAEAAQNSANSFENIDAQLGKIMGIDSSSNEVLQHASGVLRQEIPGNSENVFERYYDEKRIEDNNALFKWIENAIGVYGKLVDDTWLESPLIDAIVSPISWLKDVQEAHADALTNGVGIQKLIDLFGGGMGASDDVLSLFEDWLELEEHSLNSGVLGKLALVADVLGLGYDEWAALKDGTYEGFMKHIDAVIDDIGAITLGAGKILNIVGKGFSNYLNANQTITVFKTFTSFTTHFVGGMIDALGDDYWISFEEAANIMLDSGTHGGAALLKGITLGLIDIDADSAMETYKANADVVVNLVDSCGGSTGAQIVAGIVSSPFVFVGTTAQLIMETQPAKLLGQGAEWIEGKIHSGLSKLFT